MSGGRTTRWLRDGLVVAEVALTLLVLVTAGLLMANLEQLRAVDPGFRADGVLTARLSLPADRYRGPEERVQFARRLIEEIDALPGVVSFGTVDSLPFSGSRSTSSFDIEGEEGDAETPRTADRREVTAGYLETMAIPLLRGRSVTADDVATAAPVVVVNEAFARRFFADGEALGRRIQVGGREEVELYGEPVWREIVGVVGNLVHDDLTAAPAPEMYLPFEQNPPTRLALAVRTAGAPGDFTDTLRDAVLRVDADQPIYGVLPMSARLDNFMAMARANAWALGAFAALALVLSVLGVYSVVSYTVSQRVHELGIRIAVGAGSSDVVRLVLRQGTAQVAIGLALGLAGTLVVDRLVRTLLFRVDVFDPLLLATPVALLAAAALLACLAPALRALRIDPVEALRND